MSLYALSLSSLEILLLLPVKTVGSSAEVLEVAPCHLAAWVGTLAGRGSASPRGMGALEQGYRVDQDTRVVPWLCPKELDSRKCLWEGMDFCFWSSF